MKIFYLIIIIYVLFYLVNLFYYLKAYYLMKMKSGSVGHCISARAQE